nr:uncharacterized protein LOC108947242 [Nicotiana tomentosiformis]
MEVFDNILALKRWWRFRTIPSLWATFMKYKYCPRSHSVSKKKTSGDSYAWQKMRKVRDKAEPHILWLINSGNSSIWWDNWTGKGPLAALLPDINNNPKILVKEFIHNERWNSQKLGDAFLEEIVQYIVNINLGNQDIPDQAIWNLTENDKYIRKAIGASMRIVYKKIPIRGWLNQWWQQKSNNVIHKQILQITHIIICWGIWKSRCSCKYGDQKRFNFYKMRQQIIWNIQVAVSFPGCKLTLPWVKYCEVMMRLQHVPEAIIVAWIKPSQGPFKLNTDGNYIHENCKAGLGGTMRNGQG